MNKSGLTARMLGVGLLAALFSSANVYAQTGSAAEASATKSAPASDQASRESKSGASSSGASSAGASSSGSTGAGTAMGKSDQNMLKDLAQANMAEIKAGEIALEKSQDQQVQSFARTLVDDHKSAMKDLQALAQSKGVKLPDEMDSKHKAKTAKLEKLSGERFDKTFMAQGGVGDHEKTHKLLGKIQKNAQDTDLKSLAAKLEPTIEQHLQMAKGIKAGESEKRSGASGTSGAAASGGASSSASGAAGAAPDKSSERSPGKPADK